MPDFIFITCQVGAEKAVKGELARRWPAFRVAFSRPGFLTFKLPEQHGLAEDFDLESVFARAYGFALGKVAGKSAEELAKGVWDVCGARQFRRIHVWERDRAEPGDRGFEPSPTPAAIEAHGQIRRLCPHPDVLAAAADDPLHVAARGEMILDCVLIEPDLWWVGYHRAASVASRWPGGMIDLQLPSDAVSRAWLKMEEALRWSQLPIPPGARVVELGSAPGGASQALLSHGLIVTGIDPAQMDPMVLAHPHFSHIRARSMDVRRREFRKIRWITADMNVAPAYTLDTVESLVTHPEVNVRGLILTLKLPQWAVTSQVHEYIARVRSWGFNEVSARQLQHNRREICLAALQKPFLRKHPRR